MLLTLERRVREQPSKCLLLFVYSMLLGGGCWASGPDRSIKWKFFIYLSGDLQCSSQARATVIWLSVRISPCLFRSCLSTTFKTRDSQALKKKFKKRKAALWCRRLLLNRKAAGSGEKVVLRRGLQKAGARSRVGPGCSQNRSEAS